MRGYDNRCRSLSPQEIQNAIGKNLPFVLRFKLRSSPSHVNDLIFGRVEQNIADIEGDFVIMKSDGYPTYHFANVVDDHLMKISHVLRGEEWLISTVKHLQLYEAFGWRPPKFGHLPLLLDPETGGKLSKRNQSVFVEQYQAKGFYPLPVINFLCGYGGGFRDFHPDQLYSKENLVSMFDLSLLNRNPARIDFERLRRLNREFIKSQGISTFLPELRRLIKNQFGNEVEIEYLEKIMRHCLDDSRISTWNELFGSELSYLWKFDPISATKGISSNLNGDETAIRNIRGILDELENLKNSDFDRKTMNLAMKTFGKSKKIEYKSLMHLLRYALMGKLEGPPVGELMHLLGPNETKRRLKIVASNLENEMKKIHNLAV